MHTVTAFVGIGWIIFWVYWMISAFNSKKNTFTGVAVKQFIIIRFGIIVLALVVAIVFHSIHKSVNVYSVGTYHPIGLWFGVLLFILGFVIAIWARIVLDKNWGMPMTLKQDPELVINGPYHFVRHPIYTGVLLMTLGSVLVISIVWLIVFIVAGIYFIFSALTEEKQMTRQFPKTYPKYKRQTKMLIPYVL